MAVGDIHLFPGFFIPEQTQPLTTFLTCFCRGERLKYAGKKVGHSRGSNSQSPGLESDMVTTEPPGLGTWYEGEKTHFSPAFSPFLIIFFYPFKTKLNNASQIGRMVCKCLYLGQFLNWFFQLAK